MNIQTFGGLGFQVDDRWVYPALSNEMTGVLGALIYNNYQPLLSERLVEDIWPKTSVKKTRSALNTLIWRLNGLTAELDPHHTLKIMHNKDQIMIASHVSGVDVDFMMLKAVVHRIEKSQITGKKYQPEDITDLVSTLDLYKGGFIPKLQSDWALIARERYRSIYIRGCEIAMKAFADKRCFERAISFSKKILIENPYRENTRRQLIWLYVMNGQRAEAKKAYAETQAILHDELGVAPMPETKLLLKLIECHDEKIINNDFDFSKLMSSIQTERHTVFNELLSLSD